MKKHPLEESLSAPRGKAVHRDLPQADIPQLYGSPVILPNEALSSWAYRLAATHRCAPSAIARVWNWALPTAQLDFTDTPPAIDRMADSTFTSNKAISGAYLGGTLLSEQRYACLTQEGSAPIYRYCASCFEENEVAHYRIEWRMAFSFVCHKHRELLRNSCPHCEKGIDLSTRQAPPPFDARRALAQCPKCAGSLEGQTPTPIPDAWHLQICAFQQHMLETIRRGHFRHTRFGTISAKKWLHSYLYEDNGPKSGEKYKGINLRAALPHIADPLMHLWAQTNEDKLPSTPKFEFYVFGVSDLRD